MFANRTKQTSSKVTVEQSAIGIYELVTRHWNQSQDTRNTVTLKPVAVNSALLDSNKEGYLLVSNGEGYLLVSRKEGYLLVSHKEGYLLVSHKEGYLLVSHKEGYLLVSHKEGVFSQSPCRRLGAWLRPVSRGNRHFTVGGGRLRQLGPRPKGRLLRQPALEGLTRSARTNSPQKVGRNKFRRGAAAATMQGGGRRREVGGEVGRPKLRS
ncbi:hypothetical protein F511_27206 [Dorcoceras hygrometricum]|uniref:Uncharacterized protein n=1 Tax=Dorcoceras hygrometricum TaxID=472368 RepID=A0A2Z7BRE1_9LAMI|nr:hypothetical protein F511_27206 [Dorcoceras hygrometricum]